MYRYPIFPIAGLLGLRPNASATAWVILGDYDDEMAVPLVDLSHGVFL